jgi:DNA-binding response OmpR family regulator
LANGTAGQKRQTVVLIDDDAMILEAMTDALSAAGYAVRTARDGLEGLALIRAVKPDFIVLDIVLPKLDGGQLCAALRQEPGLQETPIIIFSGLGPNDHGYFPHLKADAYVAKGRLPVAAQNLLAALAGLAASRPADADRQFLGYENFRSRRIVNELLLARRHLQAVLRIVAPRALELDRDGHIAWMNAGACEILARTEAELIGEGFAALALPADQAGLWSDLADLVESGESVQVVTKLNLDGRRVGARLIPIVEDAVCTGILVMLEGEPAESTTPGDAPTFSARSCGVRAA